MEAFLSLFKSIFSKSKMGTTTMRKIKIGLRNTQYVTAHIRQRLDVKEKRARTANTIRHIIRSKVNDDNISVVSTVS
jgi:hypothetical protein